MTRLELEELIKILLRTNEKQILRVYEIHMGLCVETANGNEYHVQVSRL